MRAAHTRYSLRVPASWAAVDSGIVQRWMRDFFRHPVPLPDDPGPGGVQVCLSLPRKAARVLAGLLDTSETVAIRRLMAGNAASGGYLLLETQLLALVPSSAQNGVQEGPWRDPRSGLWYVAKTSDGGVWNPYSRHQPQPLSKRVDWWQGLPAFLAVAAVSAAFFLVFRR